MDRISLVSWAFIAAYPVFALLKAYAANRLRRLRFGNDDTSLEWLQVYGDGILFNWRTLLWVYLLIQNLPA